MKRQEQSSQTQTDKTVIKLLQGRDGRDGRDGVQGMKGDVGQRGEKGDQGKTGEKREPTGGVVYVRWGHHSCPSTGAQTCLLLKSWRIRSLAKRRWYQSTVSTT